MTNTCTRLLIALLSCCAALLWPHRPGLAAEQTLQLLASTFPIYQITRNLTAGNKRVQVALMIPAELGCPHDYALSPQDMRKLTKADVLIINGLGLEEFMGAPVQQANPKLRIIDSSRGITQLLHFGEAEEHDHDGHPGRPAAKDQLHEEAETPNPHLFASPRMAAQLSANIAAQLARIDPAGAPLYAANAKAYGQRLERLAEACTALGQRLRNNRIVTQHGVFDYLARDMGLEVVAVVQGHAGQEPSASEILAIVATVKEKKAGAIFTEPQYPKGVGKTIAKEAGIAAATLDPAANGPTEAPLDYYEQVMRTNLDTLERTLGSN
jgi:ABC-type Zn uptake system ZnuABC Zn-binding protein ZnuA